MKIPTLICILLLITTGCAGFEATVPGLFTTKSSKEPSKDLDTLRKTLEATGDAALLMAAVEAGESTEDALKAIAAARSQDEISKLKAEIAALQAMKQVDPPEPPEPEDAPGPPP